MAKALDRTVECFWRSKHMTWYRPLVCVKPKTEWVDGFERALAVKLFSGRVR